jgi:protein TonB
MMHRSFLWTAISAILHFLILILPFALVALPIYSHTYQEEIPVKIVGALSSHAGAPVQGQVEQQKVRPRQNNAEKTDPVSSNSDDGVNFKAEGKVSADYMTLLKARIYYVWKYPENAVLKGEQGKVGISFILNEKGELVDIKIIESSGSQSLDSAAMDAVKQASPFGSLSLENNDNSLKITGHFCYVLDQ